MAAKRVATSSVKWAAFAERVPPNQTEAYRAFKARSDMFVSRVHKFPETAPSIDWSFYKTRLANPAMVDQFQKAYESLQVSYPTDKSGVKGTIEAQEKEAQAASSKMAAETQVTINEVKALADKIKSVPPLDEMTLEMYSYYFPDTARKSKEPSFWPHTKLHQPKAFGGTDSHEIVPNKISWGKYAED